MFCVSINSIVLFFLRRFFSSIFTLTQLNHSRSYPFPKSGGPVVDAVTGRVVGVAFQSLDDAENIGYVIPVTVVQHFLEDIRRNHGNYWSGITSVGITYKRLENPTLRKYLQLPTSSSNLKTKTKTMKKLNRNNTDKNINNKDNATSGGVMIRSCSPTSPARHVLKPDDVILKIDGISVSSDGNIPFRKFSVYNNRRIGKTSIPTPHPVAVLRRPFY